MKVLERIRHRRAVCSTVDGAQSKQAERSVTAATISAFRAALHDEELSENTIEKYTCEVEKFAAWLNGAEVTQAQAVAYKDSLRKARKKSTVNGAVAALNKFFAMQAWEDLRLKGMNVQRTMFLDENRLLEKEEYLRLLETAEKQGKRRLKHIMQTLCSTGIRISELPYITVEAVFYGQTEIECKGKTRKVFLTDDLRTELRQYIEDNELLQGSVFVTRSGNPLDRSNIWRDMKTLCEDAGVDPNKVFPHNLRHLFARTFYEETKDIVKLADILGHSSIQTTRIYTRSTGRQEQRTVNGLGLVMASKSRSQARREQKAAQAQGSAGNRAARRRKARYA